MLSVTKPSDLGSRLLQHSAQNLTISNQWPEKHHYIFTSGVPLNTSVLLQTIQQWNHFCCDCLLFHLLQHWTLVLLQPLMGATVQSNEDLWKALSKSTPLSTIYVEEAMETEHFGKQNKKQTTKTHKLKKKTPINNKTKAKQTSKQNTNTKNPHPTTGQKLAANSALPCRINAKIKSNDFTSVFFF